MPGAAKKPAKLTLGKLKLPPKPLARAGAPVANETSGIGSPFLPGPIRVVGPNNTMIPYTEWDFGYGKGILAPPAPPAPAPAAAAAPAAGAAAAPAGPPKPDAFLDFRPGDSAATTQGLTDIGVGLKGSLAQLSSTETEGFRRFGVTPLEVADPVTGRMFAIDLAGNPYSEAASLKRNFDNQVVGSRINAGNTIFDGSQTAVESNIGHNRLGGFDQLVNRATDFKGGLDTQRSTLFGNALTQSQSLRGADATRAAMAVPEEPVIPIKGNPAAGPPVVTQPNSAAYKAAAKRVSAAMKAKRKKK